MLNKKDGPNIQDVVSQRRGNKTVIGKRWKRDNWIRESMRMLLKLPVHLKQLRQEISTL